MEEVVGVGDHQSVLVGALTIKLIQKKEYKNHYKMRYYSLGEFSGEVEAMVLGLLRGRPRPRLLPGPRPRPGVFLACRVTLKYEVRFRTGEITLMHSFAPCCNWAISFPSSLAEVTRIENSLAQVIKSNLFRITDCDASILYHHQVREQQLLQWTHCK